VWLHATSGWRISLTSPMLENGPPAERGNPAGRAAASHRRPSADPYTVAPRRAPSSRGSRQHIIRESTDGSPVRVRDVARVEVGRSNTSSRHVQGSRAVCRVQAPGLNRSPSRRDPRTWGVAKRFHRGSTTGSRSDTTRRSPLGSRDRRTLFEAGLLVGSWCSSSADWRATLIAVTVPRSRCRE